MECQYCKKTFKTKSNLSNHQKTAKFCIKIQKQQEEQKQEQQKQEQPQQEQQKQEQPQQEQQKQEQPQQEQPQEQPQEEEQKQEQPQEEEQENIDQDLSSEEVQKTKICKFCETVFTEDDDIPEHFEILCKIQLDEHRKHFLGILQLNDDLKKENNSIKEENNKLKIGNEYYKNNDKLRNDEIIDTYFNTSLEYVKEIIDKKLNYEYIIGGQEGIARFTVDNLLNINQLPVYTCINYKKMIFNFTNNKGDIIKDTNAKILISLLWQAEIFQKVHKLSVQKFLDMTPEELKHSMVYYEDIRNMEVDNEKFRTFLLTLL